MRDALESPHVGAVVGVLPIDITEIELPVRKQAPP